MDKQLVTLIKIGIAIVLAFFVVKIVQSLMYPPKGRNEPFADYFGKKSAPAPAPGAMGPTADDDFYKAGSYRINVPEKGREAQTKPVVTGPKRAAMGVATDLLPKEDKWDDATDSFEAIMPKAIKDQNFLEADRFYGIDTIATSNKNANLQLRADPPIKKTDVGPFLNSSYDKKDDLRKPLEGC